MRENYSMVRKSIPGMVPYCRSNNRAADQLTKADQSAPRKRGRKKRHPYLHLFFTHACITATFFHYLRKIDPLLRFLGCDQIIFSINRLPECRYMSAAFTHRILKCSYGQTFTSKLCNGLIVQPMDTQPFYTSRKMNKNLFRLSRKFLKI